MAQLMTTTSNARPRNVKPGTILIETDTGRLIVWDGQAWRLFAPSATLDQSFQNARSVYIQGSRNDSGHKTQSTLRSNAGDPLLQSNPDQLTISMWFCSYAYSRGHSSYGCTPNGGVILRTDAWSPYAETSLRINPNSVYFISSEDASGHQRLTGTWLTSHDLLDDRWHHVVVTIRSELGDQNNLGLNADTNLNNKLYCKVYVDGQILTTTTGVTEVVRHMNKSYSTHRVLGYISEHNQGLRLGPWDLGEQFCGWVDEYAWWDVELQADEIASMYNGGVSMDLSKDYQNYTSKNNLHHWYRMGDDQPVTDRQVVTGSVKDHGVVGVRWDLYPYQQFNGTATSPWERFTSKNGVVFPRYYHPCQPSGWTSSVFPGYFPWIPGPIFSDFTPSVDGTTTTRPDAMLLYHGLGVPQHNHPIHNATGDGYSDLYPFGSGADIK